MAPPRKPKMPAARKGPVTAGQARAMARQYAAAQAAMGGTDKPSAGQAAAAARHAAPKPKKRPSQASGQAAGYVAPGSSGGVIASGARKAKKKAKGIGNALVPGNPFG